MPKSQKNSGSQKKKAIILTSKHNLPLSVSQQTLLNLKNFHPATYWKRNFLDSKIIYVIPERIHNRT